MAEAIDLSLVSHPAAWRGERMAASKDWLHLLSEAELDELDRAVKALKASGKPLAEIGAADFPLRVVGPALSRWFAELQHGRGFKLVRGFPVRAHTKEDAALAYWIIGRHLGDPVSQNTDGDLLGHVRDTGADPHDRNTRLYKTRAELAFHTDGADIIGLLCLRAGRRGGVSRIASSVEVVNEVIRRRPDLAPHLFDVYPHHAHGQSGPGGPGWFPYRMVTRDGPVFRMFFLGWYIRNSQELADAPRLTAKQRELVDLVEAIALEPGMALDMDFQPGDMQFLKNSVILHARSEYEDWDASDEKRHLLRLWLTAHAFADGDDFLRRGVAARPA